MTDFFKFYSLKNVGSARIVFNLAQVNASANENVSGSSPSTTPRITDDLDLIHFTVIRIALNL